MRVDPDDIIIRDVQRSRFPIVELLLALALIGGLIAFWFWSEDEKPAETVTSIPPVITPAIPPELPPTPDIPEQETAVPVTVPDSAVGDANAQIADQNAAALAGSQTAEDGDTQVRRLFSAAGGDKILGRLASTEHPLDVSAALLDGLGRGLILRKMLPAEPLKQPFSVDREGDALYMNTASYARYDGYTDAIASLDTGVLVATFHTVRPLYKQAYEQLGLDPEDFDNAVIRTLDLILATPEISEPIALNTKSVVYVYADPALESLPAVQRQLLRMGPDNIRRIKQQARVLREGLLAQ